MAIESFGGVSPQLNEPSFIAASADIIGRVTLHPGSNVWYNATIRADVAPIEISGGAFRLNRFLDLMSDYDVDMVTRSGKIAVVKPRG